LDFTAEAALVTPLDAFREGFLVADFGEVEAARVDFLGLGIF